MDGKGRWLDNVFIEPLWHSVKYEAVYLRPYNSVANARFGQKILPHLPNHSDAPGTWRPDAG